MARPQPGKKHDEEGDEPAVATPHTSDWMEDEDPDPMEDNALEIDAEDEVSDLENKTIEEEA